MPQKRHLCGGLNRGCKRLSSAYITYNSRFVIHTRRHTLPLWRSIKKRQTPLDVRLSFRQLLHTVLFLEFIYASACIYQLLFAGEVGMALVANFYFDDVGIFSRTGLESSATSTYNSRFVIIGMYTLFHCRLPRFLFGISPMRT